MNRSDAALYLNSQLGALFTDVGVDLGEDPATALADVIDDALLLTGVAYSDLADAEVSDADVPGFRLVLRYVGLRAVYDRAQNRVDKTINDPNVSKRSSQFVDHLKDALAGAQAAAEPYLSGRGAEAFTTGAIVFGDRTIPPGVPVEAWPL